MAIVRHIELAVLEGLGAVAKTRGAIEIVARDILEAKTCECYRIISSEYGRITNAGTYRYTLEKPPQLSVIQT